MGRNRQLCPGCYVTPEGNLLLMPELVLRFHGQEVTEDAKREVLTRVVDTLSDWYRGEAQIRVRKFPLQRGPTVWRQVWCPRCERFYRTEVDKLWAIRESKGGRRLLQLVCRACDREGGKGDSWEGDLPCQCNPEREPQ